MDGVDAGWRVHTLRDGGSTRCVAFLLACSAASLPPFPSSSVCSRGALRSKTKTKRVFVVVAARPAAPNSNQFVSVSMLLD